MQTRLDYRETRALTFESLAEYPRGQYELLVHRVLALAEARKLIPASPHAFGGEPGRGLPSRERDRIAELVREALWESLVKGLVVFGMDRSNQQWPFFRVTERGRAALDQVAPQPYDPDGFLARLDEECPQIDSAVRSYVAEAVKAFNVGCLRSAAVMLGCASEKLLLLLCEAFENAIGDQAKKAAFSKELGSNWTATHRFRVLRDRLDKMVASKKLPHEHKETVASELPAGFELLRRCRNAGGQPDMPDRVETDAVFLNLRMFIEFTKRVHGLIVFFQSSQADW